MRISFKASLAAILSLGLLLIMAGAAFAAPAYPAHSKVLSSDPAIGSTISAAPTKVTVTVAENLNPDPAKSNLFVYGPGPDATNSLISQGNAQIPISNSKQMSINITPDQAHVNGVYVVVWKTVSADDGDPAEGAFSFTVNTTGASSTPTPGPSHPQTITPTSTNSSSGGVPVWALLVSALAALLLGLGAGRLIGPRKPATSAFSNMRASVSREIEREDKDK